jgi:hypothetical protein
MLIIFIKCKCPYLDALWVRVHLCWIAVQQIWRLQRKTSFSCNQKGSPISKHIMVLERIKICGWAPLGTENMKDCAAEGQQKFTVILCYAYTLTSKINRPTNNASPLIHISRPR